MEIFIFLNQFFFVHKNLTLEIAKRTKNVETSFDCGSQFRADMVNHQH